MKAPRQRWHLSLDEAEKRFHEARRERRAHREQCILWDYESDGDCVDCAHHDEMVRRARQQWRTAAGVHA